MSMANHCQCNFNGLMGYWATSGPCAAVSEVLALGFDNILFGNTDEGSVMYQKRSPQFPSRDRARSGTMGRDKLYISSTRRGDP